MEFLISSAHAQGGAQPQGSPMVSLIFMLGLFAFFWLIIIRPQRKRQKEHEALVTNLAKGDEVVMTSGLLGKVTKIDGDYLVVQAAEGIELKFQKVAVHAVLPKGTLKAI
ncbi:MAG: preprotein translocase subunit YajC [Gammaproteobacteria bacterium]|nr:preprotein translocase subunit YajC [Gammaproteobacteria bacterium]NND39940.1 preprotein translocase subunit YajC [Pseudomonadales bacterium]MBT8152143.1 preprotein translocase subunit YajC [Gammaproteobacteria bacterium]NNL10519.1 preprotein translocase subunit YajC [Pseudomonadales bacterium]NNM10659.1 preprotein translocase subunit YajC [Pseudomonadales bacterium]